MSNEESIFAEALGIASGPERAAFLDKSCAGDTRLRQQVEGLLRAYAQGSGILDSPPPALAPADDTAMPSRLQALVFTDIVDSTGIKARAGTAVYTSSLQRHNALFEQAVGTCTDARIIKHTGDGFFASFSTASDAVRCCLRFQRELAAERWPGEVLRVRIGIHQGEIAVVRMADRTDIVGSPADVASRVMSLAVAGQILLSRSAADEARRFVAGDAVRWTRHGRYKLKGVESLMEIWEVADAASAALPIPPGMIDTAPSVVPASEGRDGARPSSDRVGPYKLLEQLGEGGMGAVYMAEQTHPVRRRVALKIIKPGMDSRQVIARFEAERQALAMMDHPNIAKVFDAGTTETGRPYFVMELVKGIPITDYCDQATLTPRQRLELFIQVCHAVQHAHQKGIIHRDIKPSNVLVTSHDEKPVPKVIDFGIAKATGQQLTEHTLFTQFNQMIGTPLYMSPEQAAHSAVDVDTRSDVYSLGVLLYELLTGTTPFEKERLKEAAYDEIRRIIREEDPPKPSTRISTMGQKLTAVSAQRHTDAKRLGQLVRGELDWIAIKALEKDRARRYETANGLAMDIDRHLHDEPVLACPPSTAYRFRKFARRNKVVLMTTAIIFVTVVLAMTISTWQAIRATRAEKLAQSNLKETELARRGEETQRRSAVELAEANRLKAEEIRRQVYAARINLAQQAVEAADIPRSISLLNSLRSESPQEDLRSFEWFYLWRRCHGEQRNLRVPYVARDVAYSPDGKLLVTCNGTLVDLWDAATGDWIDRLSGPIVMVRGVAFSPDGKHVAAGVGVSQRAAVHIWNVATRREEMTLWSFGEPVTSVSFSRDGKTVAVGTANLGLPENNSYTGTRGVAAIPGRKPGRLTLWEVSSGRKLRTYDGETESILSVAFNPTNELLAGGTYGGEIILWDAATGARRAESKQAGYVSSVTFSPDGTLLASGWGSWLQSAGVTLFKSPSLERLRMLHEHKGGITSVAFSPSGNTIAASSFDRTVSLCSVESGDLLQNFIGHSDFVYGVAFAPDGKRLASAGGDSTVRVWDIDQSLSAFKRIRAGGFSVAFLPDGRAALSTGHHDSPIVLLDRVTGELKTFAETLNGDSIVAVSSNGALVAGADNQGNVNVWGAATLARRHHFEKQGEVRSIEFSPDSRLFVAGNETEVIVREAETGHTIQVLHPRGTGVKALAFSPDGKKLATATWSGAAATQIWDTSNWTARPALAGKGAFVLAYSRDGKLLAAGRNQYIIIFDARDDHKIRSIAGHNSDIWAVTFSPDCKTIASGCFDKTARLWNTSTGELLLSHTFTQPVWAVAFSRDGRSLAASCRGTYFWDAADPADADVDFDSLEYRLRELQRADKGAEAEALLRTALARYRERFGAEHAHTAQVAVDLIGLVLARHDQATFGELQTSLRQAAGVLSRKVPPEHPARKRARSLVSDLYGANALNDPVKLAVLAAHLDAAPATTAPAPLAGQPAAAPVAVITVDALTAMNTQAWKLRSSGKLDEAAALRKQVVDAARKLLPATDPRVAKYQQGYGALLAQMRVYDQAETNLLEALASVKKRKQPGAADEISILKDVIALYRNWGKPEKAGDFEKQLEAVSASTRPATGPASP